MSDDERLQRTLAKLAGPATPESGDGRELPLGEGPGEGPLAAVLTEVDETLLARRLRFRDEEGRSFALDVYGRRLLSLAPPLPAEADRTLEGRPLEEDDTPALRAALEALTRGAARMWVTADSLPEARDPARLGLAGERLAEAWGLVLGGGLPPPPAAALDRIVERAGPAALAWVRTGAGAGRGGDGAAVARLEAYLSDEGQGFRPATGDPHCTVLGRQDQDGALAVLAETAEAALMLLVRPADLPGVIAAWRSVIR